MNNVYQMMLERAGLAKPGSDVKHDNPALYRAAKQAELTVGGTWVDRVRLLYELERLR